MLKLLKYWDYMSGLPLSYILILLICLPVPISFIAIVSATADRIRECPALMQGHPQQQEENK